MDNLIFIGIDFNGSARQAAFAALDADRRIVECSSGRLHTILAYAAAQRTALAAVSAPTGFPSTPNPDAEAARKADADLLACGLRFIPPPADPSQAPAWMKKGLAVYRALEEYGYTPWQNGNNSLRWMETNAEAACELLLGVRPFRIDTLEGRLQRQLLLQNLEVNVPDPMDFFEEITRRKLLQSELPDETIRRPDELNALLAAYTAWLANEDPSLVTLVGDDKDGWVTVPVSSLPAH